MDPDEDAAERFAQQQGLIRALSDSTAAMIFQTAESRRYTVDMMMWQVPALSLTAQAFLLQIAYAHDSRWTSRLVAALLGLVAAAAAVQLLLKHRFHEELHSHWLEQFSLARNWPVLHGPKPTEAFAYRGGQHAWKAKPKLVGWKLAKHRSPYIWAGTLSLFGVADLVVIAGWIDHLATHSNPFG